MKSYFFLFFYSTFLYITLNGQVINSNAIDYGKSMQRKISFNLEEIKVRWKKAALENCTGVPCVVTPPAPSFTCGTSTVSDYEGNAYNTVLIGTQCWTESNLKVTKYNDGTLIPDLTASTSNPWAPTSGARTGYDVSVVTLSDYVGTFGYLYNWYAVNDSRKLCPNGWHVPTDSDFNKLVKSIHSGADTSSTNTSLILSISAGTVLKSDVTNSSVGSGLGWDPGTNGTNTSGFSALPGGYRQPIGIFSDIRVFAFFWLATEVNPSLARVRSVNNANGFVIRDSSPKTVGCSVRCLKD
ncbi:MAG: fibrobacter succinogenes major paralogous domain-containing protein [Saprospiraceae bacterium]|nr:fibrobacter succinogenes major paralogous domain-containing protein [Saprospiraceae bacterium]MDP4816033.1 fibrobacter succinogenes major paralogous domain-containing protein [Saprospiraceae bacterium]